MPGNKSFDPVEAARAFWEEVRQLQAAAPPPPPPAPPLTRWEKLQIILGAILLSTLEFFRCLQYVIVIAAALGLMVTFGMHVIQYDDIQRRYGNGNFRYALHLCALIEEVTPTADECATTWQCATASWSRLWLARKQAVDFYLLPWWLELEDVDLSYLPWFHRYLPCPYDQKRLAVVAAALAAPFRALQGILFTVCRPSNNVIEAAMEEDLNSLLVALARLVPDTLIAVLTLARNMLEAIIFALAGR